MAYVVLCWLILQITDVLIPILDLPNWVAKLVLLLLLLGLPIVTVLSWTFDLKGGEFQRDGTEPETDRLSNDPNGSDSVYSVPRTACCVVVTMTALYATGIAATIHLGESRAISRDIERIAGSMALEVERSITHESATMEVLRAQISTAENFSAAAFKRHAHRLLSEHPEVRAVEWVPQVLREDLESFQSLMDGHYPDYMIKQFDHNGAEVAVLEGEEFFPVAFAVPEAGNQNAIGYDLGSQSRRRQAIMQSIESGDDQMSEIITLVQTNRPGLLLLKPVFTKSIFPVNQAARRQNFVGFVVSVIDLDRLLHGSMLLASMQAQFDGRITLYHASSSDSESAASFANDRDAEYAKTYAAEATLGDRFGVSLQLRLEPSRAMVRGLYSTHHWWVGAVGLLMAIFFAALLRWLNQNARDHEGQSQAAAWMISSPSRHADVFEGGKLLIPPRKVR